MNVSQFGRILLLDDDPDYHAIFGDYLDLAAEGIPVEYLSAATQGDALELLRAKRFTAVFVDYRIGAENGIEFIRKCELEGIEAPFILLTGYDAEQASQQSAAAGAFSFLAKDEITPAALVRVIRHANAESESRAGLRNALRQAQAAADARSSFLANMSHELRTPLNGVIGFAELIIHDPNRDFGQAAKYAEYIHQSGMRLLELVEGLLTLSAAPSDTQLAKRPFRLVNVIQEICESFSLVAQARKIGFEAAYPDPEVRIVTDPQALSLALRPLINNAVKFTDAGGTVNVSVRVSDVLTVVIADTGAGMDKTTLDYACAPFYQLDSSLSRKYEGAGIGLSVARSAIAALHGELRIDSELGKGTKVVVAVPIG